jgi:hypothetical protein
MITIKSYGEGTCLWCRKENREGVDLTSDDRTFTGFLCFPDLKRLLRLKSGTLDGCQPHQTPAGQRSEH